MRRRPPSRRPPKVPRPSPSRYSASHVCRRPPRATAVSDREMGSARTGPGRALPGRHQSRQSEGVRSMKKARGLAVDLDKLRQAFETGTVDLAWFLDSKTGDV